MPLHSDAERLSLALAAANLGDWRWDAKTDVVTFSERAAAIFKIPPGPDMTWTRMRELLHPDDAGDLIGMLGVVQDNRAPAAALTAYARSNDRLRTLSARFQAPLPKPAEPAELVAMVASSAGRAPHAFRQPSLAM